MREIHVLSNKSKDEYNIYSTSFAPSEQALKRMARYYAGTVFGLNETYAQVLNIDYTNTEHVIIDLTVDDNLITLYFTRLTNITKLY